MSGHARKVAGLKHYGRILVMLVILRFLANCSRILRKLLPLVTRDTEWESKPGQPSAVEDGTRSTLSINVSSLRKVKGGPPGLP